MRNVHLRTWIMARKLNKVENETHTHTVGLTIWQEKLKNLENENCKMQNIEYGKKTENNGK